MAQDSSPQAQQNARPPRISSPAEAGLRQAVTGVAPPQVAEVLIREDWPTVHAAGAPAKLGQRLVRTVFLAPVGWLILAPLFAKKLAPFMARRYTLTNRRLMIQKGLRRRPLEQARPVQEVKLEEIDDVRVDQASHDPFAHCANLEVLSGGRVALTLPAVPEPEGFRQAILNAVRAWVPGKIKGPFVPASAPAKA
jgi:hypothetical protein